MVLPLGTVLTGIYAKYFDLKFQEIASVSFITSLITTIAIPIIGILSDKHRERGGTRKSWVMIALACVTLAGYRLMNPPSSVTIAYFSCWCVILALSGAAYDISHLAWGSELSRTYNESTRLLSIRSITSVIGAITFYMIPLFPLFKTTEITPEVLRYAAVVTIIYMIPAIYCTRYIPDGEYRPSFRKEKIRNAVKAVLSNKPFLALTRVSMLLSIGEGMWCSLSFVVYDYYYGLGKALPMTYVLSYAVTAISLPFINKLCDFGGKKRAFAILQIIFIALITLPVFLQPGKHAYIPLCLVLIGIQAVMICNFVVSNAILADAIDYGQWKYGVGYRGSYFAANALFAGIAGAIGGPLGLSIIGHFGFSSKGITDFDDAQTGIKIAFFLVPLVVSSIAVFFIMKLPICARRSLIIRRRLIARNVRIHQDNASSLAANERPL